MTERLEDYYAPIGSLTMSAAYLEEVTLLWLAALSDDPTNETRFKYLTRGLEQTLTIPTWCVNQRGVPTPIGKLSR